MIFLQFLIRNQTPRTYPYSIEQITEIRRYFSFPAMEAMEIDTEKSVQRKQATYNSLVNTLFHFCFTEIWTLPSL